jgi:hypothetical protein
MGRVTLSGPNNSGLLFKQRNTRTVYLDGVEIGEVLPITTTEHDLWEARDLKGRCHGDRWLSDWYAADALSRSYMLPDAAPTVVFCHTCQRFKTVYEHYDSEGKSCVSHLIARNVSRTWQHEYCYECWTALQSRAFCTITREGASFVATVAF